MYSKRADLNPPKEWMSRMLLGSSFQGFAHSYLRDFLSASEEGEYNLSSGMASPLPKGQYDYGFQKARRRILVVSQPNCRLAGVT